MLRLLDGSTQLSAPVAIKLQRSTNFGRRPGGAVVPGGATVSVSQRPVGMFGFANFSTPSPVFTAYEKRWPPSLRSAQFVFLCRPVNFRAIGGRACVSSNRSIATAIALGQSQVRCDRPSW
jgi:hypothetical protein